MELQTISQISKMLNLSTRALRYYEQIGLITSEKKEDYAYRVYSEDTVRRLQQIIVLRKLRIPLKQISDILKSENTAEIIDTFRHNLSEVDEEITALSTIRDIISTFINRLNESVRGEVKFNLLDDTDLLEVVDSLAIQKTPLKEEKTIADLDQANKQLSKLTDRNVRIIHLPPATIASAHYIGDGPEGPSSDMLHDFIEKSKLREIYPAARCFGFNHPNPGIRENGLYGYEFWITIPDDMDVPAPLEKKHFGGGIYAAYMILMDEIVGIGWTRMWDEWLTGHEHFEGDFNPSQEVMNGLLEEHLNIFEWREKDNYLQQVDLLMPIKKKLKA